VETTVSITKDQEHTVRVVRDSQKALKQALKEGTIGVKTATQDEYDLVLAIQDIWRSLSIRVTPLWVEKDTMATLTTEQRENIDAHQSAIARFKQHSSCCASDSQLIISQIVNVYIHGKLLTAGLPQQIITNIHYGPLQEKIKKDKGWSRDTFDMVDWRNFHRALMAVPRSHRVSISKLSHGLWNTNMQNKKFYNQSSLCPTCQKEDETLSYIFSCQHETAQ
jgi:ribonuclease HI